MTAVDQAIILAAGRGHQVDGMAKVLIRHPATGKSILEHASRPSAGKRIVVVVGYRAIHVMESAPHLNYVVNHDWALTSNAMSLGSGARGRADLRRLRGHLLRSRSRGSPRLASVRTWC